MVSNECWLISLIFSFSHLNYSYGFGPYIAPLELPVGSDFPLDISFFNSPWSVFVFLPENNARDYIADRMTRFYTETEEGRDRFFEDMPRPGTGVGWWGWIMIKFKCLAMSIRVLTFLAS